MKKTYDRSGSRLIAVRFPEDVHAFVIKRRPATGSFSAKLIEAIRKLASMEK